MSGAPGEQQGSEFEAVYEQLRAIASRHLRGAQAPTLQATVLVHEAWLRIAAAPTPPLFRDRAHFSALAARAMRQVLVDHLRRRNADKRGGGWERVTLSGVVDASDRDRVDVLALDRALSELQALSPRQASIVELRYFGGLSVPETAACLEVSTSTVEKEWRAARAWLGVALSGERA